MALAAPLLPDWVAAVPPVWDLVWYLGGVPLVVDDAVAQFCTFWRAVMCGVEDVGAVPDGLHVAVTVDGLHVAVTIGALDAVAIFNVVDADRVAVPDGTDVVSKFGTFGANSKVCASDDVMALDKLDAVAAASGTFDSVMALDKHNAVPASGMIDSVPALEELDAVATSGTLDGVPVICAVAASGTFDSVVVLDAFKAAEASIQAFQYNSKA
ncbi:hypothetical protein HDU93_006427 [Gonapodya sp. JEL0774]|nr:hypothetical protein HDU93_006427 [Gonapodya sp. JEL0774]